MTISKSSAITDQKQSEPFPLGIQQRLETIIYPIDATAKSELVRQISESSHSSELKVLLIRQITAEGTQLDEELRNIVETLRALGNTCLLKNDATRAIHYWAQINQIAVWIQKKDWVEECKQKISQAQDDQLRCREEEKAPSEVFFEKPPVSWQKALSDIPTADLITEFLPLSLEHFSLSDLIEVALQIDCGMYPLLPEPWRNPGVAGLLTFRLIADRLMLLPNTCEKASAFLRAVNEVSEQAVALIEKEGPNATIKPLINQLYEFEGGFQRKPYEREDTKKILESISHLPCEGQLCYRESDGRFFLLVHSGYVDIPLSFIPLLRAPSAAIGQAHITINEGMNLNESQRCWQKILPELGETDCPLYLSSQTKGLRYLSCKAIFKVTGVYTGTPKTNSRMKRTIQLAAECDFLQKWSQEGLGPKYKEYSYHITFAEEKREPYPRMFGIPSLMRYLQGSELSQKLARLLHLR